MLQRRPIEETISGLTTTSDKIRALAHAGYLRNEIAQALGIKYQHVRNVLVQSGISGGLQRGVEAERVPVLVEPPEEKAREETSWEILLEAGFQHVGDWIKLADGTIKIEGNIPSHPGVYALVLDDIVAYIGLTLNGLRTRMDQYRLGHKGQKTSARVNELITAALIEGRKIKVLVAAPEPLEWHGLPVNSAAGLEAGLIQLMSPSWNIRGAAPTQLLRRET
jgi:hypothetical protein